MSLRCSASDSLVGLFAISFSSVGQDNILERRIGVVGLAPEIIDSSTISFCMGRGEEPEAIFKLHRLQKLDSWVFVRPSHKGDLLRGWLSAVSIIEIGCTFLVADELAYVSRRRRSLIRA